MPLCKNENNFSIYMFVVQTCPLNLVSTAYTPTCSTHLFANQSADLPVFASEFTPTRPHIHPPVVMSADEPTWHPACSLAMLTTSLHVGLSTNYLAYPSADPSDRPHKNSPRHMYKQIHMYKHTYINTNHTHVLKHARNHALMHAYAHTHITQIRAYTHTHA